MLAHAPLIRASILGTIGRALVALRSAWREVAPRLAGRRGEA
jgi:hypothetical protein